MNANPIHLLNRLMAIQSRSLPQYLRYSRPHVPPGRGEVLETLEAVAADQDVMTDRISRMVIDADALPQTGEFPMEFTDLHDLHIDYLVNAAVRYQEEDLAEIQKHVDRLQAAPAAKSLAEECLGLAKGHLDTLRDLAAGGRQSEPDEPALAVH
jgi:hypothetical protein